MAGSGDDRIAVTIIGKPSSTDDDDSIGLRGARGTTSRDNAHGSVKNV
jgi:hypothetical protein